MYPSLECASEIVEVLERLLRCGVIGRDEALRMLDRIIARYGRIHRELELALEELLDFRRKIGEK